jgi:hypothetical protein
MSDDGRFSIIDRRLKRASKLSSTSAIVSQEQRMGAKKGFRKETMPEPSSFLINALMG